MKDSSRTVADNQRFADNIRLSDRIRLARHDAKLTQTELAQRLGVTPSAAAQWEHPNGTTPGVHRLRAIASATAVLFDWLASGEGPRRKTKADQDDSIPALKLEHFAQDNAEEILLMRFRMLSPRGRQLLSDLLEEFKVSKRLR